MVQPDLEDSITLKVAEALQDEVGYGRGRLDTLTRNELDLSIGDIVEIHGRRRDPTVAIVWRARTEDEGKGIIRVDDLIRKNAKVNLGDKVEVKKTQVKPAQKVVLAPVTEKVQFGPGIEEVFLRGLNRRPLTKGDVVIVPGLTLMGGRLPFAVTVVQPKGIIQIQAETVIQILEEPINEEESTETEEHIRETGTKNIEKTETAPETEDSKVETDSSMRELEKLIERRNAGEITSKEFEEMKKEILERKPQVSKEPVVIVQEEAQGDYIDDRDTIEEEKVMPKEKEVTKEVPVVASPVFMEQLDQLQGTKNARLLMGDKVADEVSISGLQEVLETRKDNGVNTLVMDGIITQRLIELVHKAGINIIVAEKKGPLSRDPVGITMFTREDLVKGSVVSKSNVGAGGDDKFARLEKLTEMKVKGLIDEDEFKQMKKEIMG